jgi:hypothetical protein
VELVLWGFEEVECLKFTSLQVHLFTSWITDDTDFEERISQMDAWHMRF